MAILGEGTKAEWALNDSVIASQNMWSDVRILAGKKVINTASLTHSPTWWPEASQQHTKATAYLESKWQEFHKPTAPLILLMLHHTTYTFNAPTYFLRLFL